MDQIQFHEQVPVLINQFGTRIPIKYWDGFTDMLDGGEFAMAIDSLVAAIEELDFPVTDAEQKQIQEMLNYYRPSTSASTPPSSPDLPATTPH